MKMKRLIAILAILLCTAGCHKNVQAPVPGQIDTFDASSFRTLMDAQAAIGSFRADIAQGTLTLNDSQKKIFNQLITDYNTAESLWQLYHAGASNDQAAIQSAVTALVNDLSDIAIQIHPPKTGGK